MAQRNFIKFLLNRGADAKAAQIVDAPAFSLTKVMGSAAVVVTPIASIVVERLTKANLTGRDYVVLALGLLAFLAITSAADVLGRSMATAAEKNAQASREAAEKDAAATERAGVKNAQASVAAMGQIVPFAKPLAGHRVTEGEDPAVQILAAAYAGKPHFLVKEGNSITWHPTSKITMS